MTRTLVAGIGNIFCSDDGFGVEVVRRLTGVPLPAGVEVLDVGIRGVHLAYQLMDGYDRLVIVDASPRGQEPGTVSLLEVDPAALPAPAPSVAGGQVPLVDAHGLEPAALLGLLGSWGAEVPSVLVVACEPESLDDGLGLSACVEAAVPRAVAMVQEAVLAGPGSSKEVPG